MKDYKFSNGIIEINGHKISYDISYDEFDKVLPNVKITRAKKIDTVLYWQVGDEENK